MYSNQNPNINNCISDINDNLYTSNLASLKLLVEEIFQSLSTLDLNLCPGPDGIPNILLRSCSYSLAVPIHKLFSHSLSKGIFPFQWKNSYITPIHKSGIKSLVSNYRPITKLSAIPKLLEMLMMPWLTFSFKNLINTTQHGFIKGHSVNLLCFYNAISKSMESGTQTDVVYTDFSKAFDSVNHSLLLAKLRLYSISDPLLSWFNSYLSDRTQQVEINGFLSDPFPAPSGVPQGGHISPLLFAIFIIDIGTCFSYCDHLLFADDLKFLLVFLLSMIVLLFKKISINYMFGVVITV